MFDNESNLVMFDNESNYYDYLNSLSNKDKIEWVRNIVNTNMDVLAIPIPILRNIAKEIIKNDYISFLDKKMLGNYESTIIYGVIINNLKDINLIKKYLDIYVNYVDNWSSCDILSIKTNDKDKLFNIGIAYTESNKCFVRRVGYKILFGFVKEVNYLNKIFEVIDNNNVNEEEYYVNMMVSWLLCEAFIHNRELTIKYLDNNRLNSFTINKFVSKCRDSFRVSKEDKDMLLKYKK